MSSGDEFDRMIKGNLVGELSAYLDENPESINESFGFGPYGMMFTLLQEAVQMKRPDIVKMLLEKGADPNYKGEDLTPPIFYALEDETCFFLLI